MAAVLALAAVGRLRRTRRVILLWAILFGVMASHGLLDCLTDGGLGIALLAPWSAERYFAPVQPIPVSPIGPGIVLTRYGWSVIAWEALLFGPLWLLARVARNPAGRPAWWRTPAASTLLLVWVASWARRLLP